MLHLSLGLSVLAASSFAINDGSLIGDPVVQLGYANYHGSTSLRSKYNTDVYYGIKYAQPPTGSLRWQPPQPIESQNSYNPSILLDATQSRPPCVQGVPFWSQSPADQAGDPTFGGQEDCLLLDVYVPTPPRASGLPVLVNIHGGGYNTGSSGTSAQALVNASSKGLIFVSVQYRLGAFGFLSSSEIRENGAANAGLLDQRAALNWVQRNIAAFGGNPAKVTIYGGSAGGGSVMNQMILYGGQKNPPFRAAISEYPWFQPYHNDTVLEDQYRTLLEVTGCADLQCLRTVSSATLIAAAAKSYKIGFTAQPSSYYGYGDFYYGPSVDGQIIRDLPSNEFKQGHFTKVPLLVDRDGYEGYTFSDMSENTAAEELRDLEQLFPYARQSFFTRLYELFPRSSYNSTFFQRQDVFGNFIINCPTYYMAKAVADWGLPTYKMLFYAGSQLHAATATFLFTPDPYRKHTS